MALRRYEDTQATQTATLPPMVNLVAAFGGRDVVITRAEAHPSTFRQGQFDESDPRSYFVALTAHEPGDTADTDCQTNVIDVVRWTRALAPDDLPCAVHLTLIQTPGRADTIRIGSVGERFDAIAQLELVREQLLAEDTLDAAPPEPDPMPAPAPTPTDPGEIHTWDDVGRLAVKLGIEGKQVAGYRRVYKTPQTCANALRQHALAVPSAFAQP